MSNVDTDEGRSKKIILMWVSSTSWGSRYRTSGARGPRRSFACNVETRTSIVTHDTGGSEPTKTLALRPTRLVSITSAKPAHLVWVWDMRVYTLFHPLLVVTVGVGLGEWLLRGVSMPLDRSCAIERQRLRLRGAFDDRGMVLRGCPGIRTRIRVSHNASATFLLRATFV
jgi:hypothetical protein